jgi:hypothetical protein
MHMHMHTHTHHTRTYIHTYICTYTRTHKHTQIHAYTHTPHTTHVHTYTHTYVRIHARTHTQIHAYIHTYIHTHAYIHALICSFLLFRCMRDSEPSLEGCGAQGEAVYAGPTKDFYKQKESHCRQPVSLILLTPSSIFIKYALCYIFTSWALNVSLCTKYFIRQNVGTRGFGAAVRLTPPYGRAWKDWNGSSEHSSSV